MRAIALALALAAAGAASAAAPPDAPGPPPSPALDAALAHLAARNASYVDDLLEFVAIPGISSLPEHAGDLAASAAWVKARLERAGLENVKVLMAGTAHPAVYGDWLHAGPRKAVVLIYGHHDVQPASSDPSIEPWTTPPFKPVVRDGCVFGRGAQDDKGGLLGAVAGVEAFLQSSGALPVNVKFLIEGQARAERGGGGRRRARGRGRPTLFFPPAPLSTLPRRRLAPPTSTRSWKNTQNCWPLTAPCPPTAARRARAPGRSRSASAARPRLRWR